MVFLGDHRFFVVETVRLGGGEASEGGKFDMPAGNPCTFGLSIVHYVTVLSPDMGKDFGT